MVDVVLTTTQRAQMRLLAHLGVNGHVPRSTAKVLVRHGLIEWTGSTSSRDGLPAAGYILTDAGKKWLRDADGVADRENVSPTNVTKEQR